MAPAKRRRTAASTPSLARGPATQSKLSFRSTKAGSKDTNSNLEGKLKTVTSGKGEIEDGEKSRHSADYYKSESPSSNKSEPVQSEGGYRGPLQEPHQPDENEANHDAIARAISDSDISRYWKSKEQERKAPRVHQEGLTMHDKILREFDMTARFGPSIGITRLARWRRAKEVGMEPPFEVLSILLGESLQKDMIAQQESIVDELMMTSRKDVISE